MSSRMARQLAWFIWTLSVVFGITTLYFQIANDSTRLVSHIFGTLVNLSFATVATLIAARRPENRIGWLLSVSALVWALGGAMLEYGVYALMKAPHLLPVGAWMAWYGFGFRGGAFALLATFLPLIFPDGHLPSRRWRWAAWLAASSFTLFSVSSVIGSSSQDDRLPFLHNPLGVELPTDLSDLLATLYVLALGATLAVCVAAAVVRFRRAKGDERQQLKWFAYAAVLGIFVFLGIVITFVLPLSVDDRIRVSTFLFDLLLAGFPIAVGIAILKYRLYNIDIIFRRTLIYGVLTASLAFVYFGSVVLLQQLFRALTGQSSELAIIVSTLGIAALFVPLRRRVQSTIDRRFYRRKYDAQKVLAEFAATARDEVDLNQLTERLLAVVDETMQPAHVSLWLRPTERELKR